MNSCYFGPQNDRFDAIIKYWNSKKLITKNIGKIGGNSVEDYRTELYLNDISEYLFKIPFNSEFEFSDGMLRRMRREIDNIETNYKTKKINALKRYFYVPDAIASYSPVTRMFYEEVNMAINFERNNLDHYLTYSKSISSHIRKALVTVSDMTRKKAKGFLKEMADLEAKILRGESNEVDNNKLLERYEKLYNEEGGGVLKDYVHLMELDNVAFANEKSGYDRNLIFAVEESRVLLDNMGGVLVKGLEGMKSVIKMTYDNPILPKTGEKYIERINEAIKSIETTIKAGGYLPHYILDNVVETNYRMRKLLENKDPNIQNQLIGDIVSGVEIMTQIPDQAKGRNVMLNNAWSKNPFYVLTQYSKDVIAYNKINYIQKSYLPAIKRFQKEDVNPEFIRSMREFIDDTFQVSTKGLQERPDWVNATVRGLTAAETLKSMGLSVTGAIRNGASAMYFFAENGIASANAAIKKYNSHYKGVLSEIELNQGFEFGEAGRELIADGLIPSSVNTSDIMFNPITQKVSYRDKGVLKTLDPIIDTAVGSSLVFHRFTENLTRKWMFRIAWVQAYENLRGHNLMNPSDIANKTKFEKSNEKLIRDKATNFALKSVNKFAFEYAAHAKARGIGGTAPIGELGPTGLPIMKSKDYMTAMGEITFQFMHYPMSFLNLQSKILKGSYDAALSKQWDAPEIKQALRFAGIYMTVGALSVMTNLDLTNTLENDTVAKLQDFHKYLTADEKDLEGKMYGVVNQFTGPAVSDSLYALNMFGLTRMPDSYWGKVALGYIDYYEEEGFHNKDQSIWEKKHFWNKVNVEVGRWINKNIPAIRDGRGIDLIRHELGWYPRKHLKEKRKTWNERIDNTLGFKPFKIKKPKMPGAPQISASNQKILDLLQDLKS